MDVTTKDKNLLLALQNDPKAAKKFGANMLRVLQQRIKHLQRVNNLEEIRNYPGRFHELVDNRKGQWACDLGQPYRLVFIPHENPIPTDENGKYIWIEIKGVELIEVTNYHGK